MWVTVAHNWPYLLASVAIASAIQVFVGADRLGRAMRSRTWLAVGGAVALGALTPFCSCGTMAVVLGALVSEVPRAHHFTGGPGAQLVALGHARASGARGLSTIVAAGNMGRVRSGPVGGTARCCSTTTLRSESSCPRPTASAA